MDTNSSTTAPKRTPQMPDLLEEAKQLSEAATPGPWYANETQHRVYSDAVPDAGTCRVAQVDFDGDVPFIARARTFIPELVERLEQERDENDKLRGEVRMLRGEPALAAQHREAK